MVSGWYRNLIVTWVVLFVPLHCFIMLFNNKSPLSMPDTPGPDGSPLGLYLVYIAVMFSPILALPFALLRRQ